MKRMIGLLGPGEMVRGASTSVGGRQEKWMGGGMIRGRLRMMAGARRADTDIGEPLMPELAPEVSPLCPRDMSYQPVCRYVSRPWVTLGKVL